MINRKKKALLVTAGVILLLLLGALVMVIFGITQDGVGVPLDPAEIDTTLAETTEEIA